MDETSFVARWILPVSAPPLRHAHVRVRGAQIVAVGPGRPPDAIDLGDVVLLPGLINAHCHLEFSHLAEPIGSPGMPLERWIVDVVRHRTEISSADPKVSIRAGLQEVHSGGTRLVCDIASTDWSDEVPWPPGAVTEAVLMPEVIGLSTARAAASLDRARRTLRKTPPPRIGWGISPHAPYSTLTETIENCTEIARRQDLPLAMHVAESDAEDELTVEGRGRFVAGLRELGAWQDGLFPTGRDQVQLIDALCRAPRALVVHGNYLSNASIQRLASSPNATVVYCPRTHAFFGHPPHPIDRLLAAGVRVALGTDSRASNPDLSLWRELQFVWQQRRDLDPLTILRCATLEAADALGRPDLGRIAAGAHPGLLTVPTTANTMDQLLQQLAEADCTPAWVS